ncbi:DUF2403 domain-containing lipoprotein [Nannocystaceae bacterium ST9]
MSDRIMRLMTLAAVVSGCATDPASDEGSTDDEADVGDNGDDGDGDEGSSTGPMPPPVDGGLGPAEFGEGELDPASHGGTITFQTIGAPGWYPSRRDPALGPCDAYETDSCCLAQHEVAGDALTPWDEDLILTLRGPLLAKQIAVYQPSESEAGDAWALVSAWDSRTPASAQGIAFHGEDTESTGFAGAVGTECLVDVSTDAAFACGPGSSPYCPESDDARHYGWSGSKLFVLLAKMPHADEVAVGTPCSEGTDGNWYDAPWLGLSLGELVRAGAFSDCQCYAKNPAEWWLGDGCGQFNVFEVVNDNNEFRNLEIFSTNFFGYAGYVGEGPCGSTCDVSNLAPDVDLIDKTTHEEASMGALASPEGGPGAAFRRPSEGYRYFLIHLDVATRTVQLGIVHPEAVPSELGSLLPSLPAEVSQATIDALLGLRLPQ